MGLRTERSRNRPTPESVILGFPDSALHLADPVALLHRLDGGDSRRLDRVSRAKINFGTISKVTEVCKVTMRSTLSDVAYSAFTLHL